VGFQSHFIEGKFHEDLQRNMERFAALDLDVALTEIDVRIQLPVTEQALAQQAKDYASIAQACLAVPRCVGMTMWGVTDKHSWVPEGLPGFGAAHLWDEQYKEKPAYAALQQALVAAH